VKIDQPSIKTLVNQGLGRPQNVDFELFWQVWNKINEKYVDKSKLDVEKMLYGAIGGMVDSVGDPYTIFLEPQVSKKFQEEISGTFSGVGIEIGKRDDFITVIAPIKNSPAYKAGIKAGDRILQLIQNDC